MTTQFNIGVDWRRKGVICWEAQPEDALNILPQPIRYTTLDWRTNTADDIDRQSVDTDYGINLFAVQTGSGTSNGFVMGESDASDVDTIITVCDRAREVCPTFPGEGQELHWGFPDPVVIENDITRQQAFTEIAIRLQSRIKHFLYDLK